MRYPYLSRKDIEINPELAARIPAYLAYYHEAIPVAEEDEQITLWMVYPDNPKVVNLFFQLLKQPVFPVRGSQEEIRETLDHLYARQGLSSDNRFLNGSDRDYVSLMARVFRSEVIDADDTAPEALLKQIQQDAVSYSVVALDAADSQQARTLLRQSPCSVLLTHGQYPDPHRILVILQGHSPDLQAVQVGLQIAGVHQAEITVLGIAAPMKRHQIQGIATLLDSDTKSGQHVQQCLAMIQDTGIEGFVMLRQGIPEEQIAREFTEAAYDLMVIPVETYGDFVYRVLEQIEICSPHQSNPILAVKPSR